MPIMTPTNCANPDCGGPAIRSIHHSAQAIAIDAVDGPPVFAHHMTYRCSQCGHTWAIQGYSADANGWLAKEPDGAMKASQTMSGGW